MKIYLEQDAVMPTRAHDDDAGLDLYTKDKVIVPPMSSAVANTGVHISIPRGFVGLLTSKSGLMRNNGITCRGTIDAGYTGSIQAVLFNHKHEAVVFEAGQKVTQLVVLPIPKMLLHQVETLDELGDTERGSNGFGSTGK